MNTQAVYLPLVWFVTTKRDWDMSRLRAVCASLTHLSTYSHRNQMKPRRATIVWVDSTWVHATTVHGAYGLSTVGLVSGPYGDSRLILPTRDCDFVKSTRGLRAICFGQVAPTIQDNWCFGINPIYIDYIDLDAVQRLACKKNDNKI